VSIVASLVVIEHSQVEDRVGAVKRKDEGAAAGRRPDRVEVVSDVVCLRETRSVDDTGKRIRVIAKQAAILVVDTMAAEHLNIPVVVEES